MTKNEYLNELARRLKHLPKEDYHVAMAYFDEYFEEAGPEHEAEAIRDLGTPREAAEQILKDLASQKLQAPPRERGLKKGLQAFWIVILAIFASPIALPIAFAGAALLFSAVLVVGSLMFSAVITALAALVSSIVCLIGGIVLAFSAPMDGIAAIGLGLIGLGFSLLFTCAALWICQKLAGLLRKLFQKLMKGGRRNEKRN